MNQPLDISDFMSPTWAKIRSLLRGRIANYREDLDAVLAPEAEHMANVTRGRIRELKDLLALEVSAPADEDEPA